MRDALAQVDALLPTFIKQARAAGWRVEEGALLVGSPRTISIHTEGSDESMEDVLSGGQDEKKRR